MIIDIHAHIVDPVYMARLRDVLSLEAQHTDDGKTLYRHDGYTIAWERPDMYDIDHRLQGNRYPRPVAEHAQCVLLAGRGAGRGDARY